MTDSSTAEVRDKGLLLLSQRFAAWLTVADVCLRGALAIYESSAVFETGVPARTRGQQQSIVQNLVVRSNIRVRFSGLILRMSESKDH